MNIKNRIFLFIIFILLLAIIFFSSRFFAEQDYIIKVLILSSLILLSFTSLFLEHFFTTPSDVLASSISILLLLAPLKNELNGLGKWYWIYISYVFIILLIALIALLLFDKNKPSNSWNNRISSFLKKIAVFWGNGRWLFTSLFLIVLLFFINSNSNLFIILSVYAAMIILVDPKKFTLEITKNKKSVNHDLGQIIGVQSRNTFIAKLFTDHVPLHRFDLVEFRYSMSEKDQILTGIIIDNYLLNEQQWIKILSSNQIRQIVPPSSSIEKHKTNIVYKIDSDLESSLLRKFVGIIVDNSNINKIKFEYASKIKIQEGDLLEIRLDGNKILYQVIEGITEIEILESKNKAGKIIGEAIQLGIWNSNRLRFEKYGWVPEINTPIFLAEDIEEVTLPENSLKLGNIPNTNYPLVFDIEEAVTHHLGILGVTGTGKSVFTRDLIRKIIKNNTKVICVDFTNEYKIRFSSEESMKIIKEETEKTLFDAIDDLSNELSKFKNQQSSDFIKEKRKILLDNMKQSIEEFINSDKNIAIFELPDVENTTGILEYTRWFFKALFYLARQGKFDQTRVSVVLEEAHTVIPEWNFIGVEEKKAQALVNAIGQIALQGRKYNIGFIIVAQRTANVSKTVLTQCNSIIAFQQFDKTSKDFLSNYMDEKMVNSLSSLKFRQACAVGRAFKSGVPIIFEVPFIKEDIFESTPNTGFNTDASTRGMNRQV